MDSFTGQALTLDSEYAILEACIGWSTLECKKKRHELVDYIDFYRAQTAQLDLMYSSGGERWPFQNKQHQQLLDVLAELQKLGPAVTRCRARHSIRTRLKILNVEDYIIDSLMDAVIRMWILVNFRSSDDSSVGRGRPCVEWTDNDRFADTLTEAFQRSTTELPLSQRRLNPNFTAVNMVNICGLKIEWAATLDDHLSLDRHRRILRVFPLRNWLNIQAEHASVDGMTKLVSQGQTQTPIPHAPLPKILYEETSRTLDLLFPSWDPATQRYLKKRGKDFHLSYSNPRLLDLKHYSYWKDRLLELNEDIFLAPPEGWSQLWRDRRDPQKFWTFWIALLVLWLSVVATVATIVQTWAALTKS